MPAKARPQIDTASSPPHSCVGKGGCSYLRALAKLELLAGFDSTARLYERSALRCQTQGCWAATRRQETTTEIAPTAVVPIPLKPASPAARVIVPSAETVPFDRSALVDRVSDMAGNFVERRALKLESLAGAGDPLGYIFNYWRQLRVGTECTLSNIDTVHLERAGVIGNMHVINVSDADPDSFRFELSGYAVPLVPYEKPRAFPIAIYAHTTLSDYNTSRLTAMPRLHRVRCLLDGVNHHYTRLVLPFLDARGAVSRLVVVIRQEPGNGVGLDTGQ